ncbi:MAG: hypothetical protein U1E40_06765 [Amaricoccus sp.]
MRGIGILAALALAGCAATGETAGEKQGEVRAAQEAACAAAVAKHVGKPVDAVSSTWDQETAGGGAIVTVTDPTPGGKDRVHTCEVDAAANVHAILHPGA